MNKFTLKFEDKEVGQQYLVDQRRRAKVLYVGNAIRIVIRTIQYIQHVSTLTKESTADEILSAETNLDYDECVAQCVATEEDTSANKASSVEMKSYGTKLIVLAMLLDLCCFMVFTLGLIMIKLKSHHNSFGRLFDS